MQSDAKVDTTPQQHFHKWLQQAKVESWFEKRRDGNPEPPFLQDAKVYMVPPTNATDPCVLDKTLHCAAADGRVDIVETLLDLGADPSSKSSIAFRSACYAGHARVVEVLLRDPRVQPMALYNWAMQAAIVCGHVEVLRVLLACPRITVTHNLYASLHSASVSGFCEVVHLFNDDVRVQQTLRDDSLVKIV